MLELPFIRPPHFNFILKEAALNSDVIPLVDVVGLSKSLCDLPIIGDLKYAYHENFVGRPIAGYESGSRDICLLAPQASLGLCQIQNHLLKEHGLSLYIFDAYRPLRAVRDFGHWFNQSPTPYELERKQIHFPTFEKQELVQLGYIANNVSNHCYGLSVDLTLYDVDHQVLLNMGTCFDYFNSLSHATMSPEEIGSEAYNNRKLLFNAMHSFGFQVHPKEYWHFDFQIQENTEPLDFPITESLRGYGMHLINELEIKGSV